MYVIFAKPPHKMISISRNAENKMNVDKGTEADCNYLNKMCELSQSMIY